MWFNQKLGNYKWMNELYWNNILIYLIDCNQISDFLAQWMLTQTNGLFKTCIFVILIPSIILVVSILATEYILFSPKYLMYKQTKNTHSYKTNKEKNIYSINVYYIDTSITIYSNAVVIFTIKALIDI